MTATDITGTRDWPRCPTCTHKVRDGGPCTPCRERQAVTECDGFRLAGLGSDGWARCACGARLMLHPDTLTTPHAYVRRDAATTSRKAASRTLLRSGTRRRLVLEAVVESIPSGMTDDEIGRQLGMGHQSVGPRRLELVEAGYLEDSGERRPTRYSNSQATVWLPTVAGLDALEGAR